MARLGQKVRETTRQGKMFPATVVDRGGGKATVRLSGNGATYRMLPLVGGPVTLGQQVYVDFNTYPPQVVAPTEDQYDEAVNRTRTREIPRQSSVTDDERMIRRYEFGITLVETYSADESGMQEALDDANPEDMILLPAIQLFMNFTIPAQVNVTGETRYTSVVNGTVTLGAYTVLDRIKVLYTSGSAPVEDAIAVILNGSNATIHDSDIWACNCYDGIGYGIKTITGSLTIRGSFISGEGEPGYGIYTQGGTVTLYDSPVYGTTDQFSNHGAIYVNGTTLGSSPCACLLTVGIPSSFISSEDNGTYKSIIPPWISGVTLGDITSGSPSLQVYDKIEAAGMGAYGLSDIGAYGTKLFLTWGNANPAYIWRINIDGISTGTDQAFTSGSYGDESYYVHTCVINESTVYTIYGNSHFYSEETGDEIYIAKIVDGVTVLETFLWNEYEEALGAPYPHQLSEIYWITRHTNEVQDVLVACLGWSSGFDSGTYPLSFVVYDLLTDTVVNKEFILQIADETVTADSDFWWYFPPPACYGNYVICTTGTYGSGDNMPGSCVYPHFLIDIRDGSVTRIQNLTEPSYVDSICMGAGVDKNTGIYYFTMWEHITFGYDGDGWVGSVDLNSESPFASYEYKQVDGKESGFGVSQGDGSLILDDWNNTPTVRYIRNITNDNVLNSMAGFNGNMIVDSEQNVAYTCDENDPDVIHGYRLDSAYETFDIQLTGGSGYTYPAYQYKYTSLMCIYNGVALVYVYSRSPNAPYTYQRDIYFYGL